MLTLQDITYRIGARILLERASAQIPAGRRVGLVGRNGAGKSTLLGLILGELHAEAGTIDLPKRRRIGCVAQEALAATPRPSRPCWRPTPSACSCWPTPTRNRTAIAWPTSTPG